MFKENAQGCTYKVEMTPEERIAGQVKAMLLELNEQEKADLLATHGKGLPIEQKHAILTEYLAARQKEQPVKGQ